MTGPTPRGTVATLGPDTPDGAGTLDAIKSDYTGGDAHQADDRHAGTLAHRERLAASLERIGEVVRRPLMQAVTRSVPRSPSSADHHSAIGNRRMLSPPQRRSGCVLLPPALSPAGPRAQRTAPTITRHLINHPWVARVLLGLAIVRTQRKHTPPIASPSRGRGRGPDD